MLLRVTFHAPASLRIRRPGDRWWHIAATVIAVASIAGACLALLLHTLRTTSQCIVLATSVSHQLMWAALLGVVAAVAVRRFITAAVAAVVCLIVAAVQVPPLVADGHPAGGRALVVLQSNLKIGSADPAALVGLVRSRHVDVLATEELTYREETALLDAGLANVLPHRFTSPLSTGGSGLGIWSRFPLTNAHDLPEYSAGVMTAHVDVPGHDFTFFAVHLSPPYRQPFATWRNEIAAMRGTLDDLSRAAPVVAAGDYNSTVDHAQFRALLTDGYDDAAEQAGAGYLPTYPDDRWWGPVIGIDHVLTRGAVGTAADTFSVPGSDHRALLVHLWLA
jgi:endonuclease/exonuclease/phosphatase (EEP) superfamily protein YafD